MKRKNSHKRKGLILPFSEAMINKYMTSIFTSIVARKCLFRVECVYK